MAEPLRPEELLNEDQLVELLHSSKPTVQRNRMTGDGPPFIKMGRSVRYLRRDVEAWLLSRRRTSTSDPGPKAA